MRHTLVKHISRALLCGFALTGPIGCTDFLKEQAPSNLTPTSFYTIPDHAESALASVYASLRFMGDGAGIFSSNWQLLEALTGTSTTETAQNSDLNNLYSLVHDGNTGHVVNYWNGLYRVIANANQLLDKVPGITPMDAAQKPKFWEKPDSCALRLTLRPFSCGATFRWLQSPNRRLRRISYPLGRLRKMCTS